MNGLSVKAATFALGFMLISTCCTQIAFAQQGCTDGQALNYDPGATVNDGSCLYPQTSISLGSPVGLQSPSLDECSGLCYVNGKLWAHIDNAVSTVYSIDTLTGNIIDSVQIDASNNDWEDICTDGDYIYIGDFGNNWGDRTNLRVLKFPAASLDTATFIEPEEISFAYADQVSFAIALNNHSFDCEAFFYFNDSLHLFTKDWVGKWTKHYVLPLLPGSYSLTPVDSFHVDGLVTSAAISDSVMILTCYNSTVTLPVFMWGFYDFSDGFFSGNKRKLDAGALFTAGQVEAVEFTGSQSGFIGGERFQYLVFNVAPRIHPFDLSPYLSLPVNVHQHLYAGTAVYPNPVSENIYISPSVKGPVIITDVSGRVLQRFNECPPVINISRLPEGYYLLVNAERTMRFPFVVLK